MAERAIPDYMRTMQCTSMFDLLQSSADCIDELTGYTLVLLFRMLWRQHPWERFH